LRYWFEMPSISRDSFFVSAEIKKLLKFGTNLNRVLTPVSHTDVGMSRSNVPFPGDTVKKDWLCLRVLSFCAVISLIFAVGPVRLQAQQTDTSEIRGNVLDPTGNVIVNAIVGAKNDSSGEEDKTSTDDQGKFSISGLAPGVYTVEVSSPGFALASRQGIIVGTGQTLDLSFSLVLGNVNEAVTVEANTSGSVAAQLAPMDGLLEATSARTEISPMFIKEFTLPQADFNEVLDMAPGTFSYNANGNGLGQSKLFFRGFPDGDYDMNFDNVPFYDTNTPTHHSWAFFPAPFIGSVDFDRSPGDASTTGPTPFGGSINLISPDMPPQGSVRVSVTGSSWNTILEDVALDYGDFGPGHKSNLIADVDHMNSSGYESFNYQERSAGMLKYQLKISENNVLTGFSAVQFLDSNTPNSGGPTRAEVATYGLKFLLTDDTNPADTTFYPLNYHFYTYHVPTDFEYVDWRDELGRGWQIDFQPYTLSYYNAQYYNNPSIATCTAPATGCAAGSIAGLTLSAPSSSSAVDKLNSYRKYGENLGLSKSSKFGVIRAGLWYEWAKTNRYQIPSDPLTLQDAVLPNFHERFDTDTLQPFAEFEYHATRKLTITGGFKYAYFRQDLTQYQDNGKTVGCLGGVLTGTAKATEFCTGGDPTTYHGAGYNAYLPSLDANYRIKSNWSLYAQYGTGTVVPPSGVFDVTGANVTLTPKPTGVYVYQGGTVLKFKYLTLNGDAYYIHFQNAFVENPDSNATTGYNYEAAGDAVSKGAEAEGNVYLTHGLSVYANATVGTAKYVTSGLVSDGQWVANAPSNTEGFGVTYQQKYLDIGIFDKRVGPMWNDNNNTAAAIAAGGIDGAGILHQVIPINPFSLTDFYFNYTIRNGSHLDQTALRFSVNNLFNSDNTVNVVPAVLGGTYTPSTNVMDQADILTFLPGRSFAISLTFGYDPHGR
jgi:iron complex outermembrane receptor protein